jgi:hypothetical protein
MCTHVTEKITATGSAKGTPSWMRITDATVYFDHPAHAMADHTLNIDFLAPAQGPGARVAVELTADTAEALIVAIRTALDAVPVALR